MSQSYGPDALRVPPGGGLLNMRIRQLEVEFKEMELFPKAPEQEKAVPVAETKIEALKREMSERLVFVDCDALQKSTRVARSYHCECCGTLGMSFGFLLIPNLGTFAPKSSLFPCVSNNCWQGGKSRYEHHLVI